MKRAFIFDLDNTLFPTPSIGDKLFEPLLKLIGESEHKKDYEGIKHDIMRIPFQVIAERYGFSDDFKEKGMDIIRGLEYNDKILPYEDYSELKKIKADFFLVTAGSTKMQQSKIKGLGIESDFKEINIVDSDITPKTKKDIFREILDKHGYRPEEVLVIGDDPESELKAARELGIESVLYDKDDSIEAPDATYTISDYKQLPVD